MRELSWPVFPTREAATAVGDLAPIEILYEFEEPLIFTARSSSGRMLFVYAACRSDFLETPDSAQSFTRYLVAPTSPAILEKLKKGAWTVLQALDQPILWIADVLDLDCSVSACELSGLGDVPEAVLPERDRTLWAHLMPILSYRLIGDGLVEGEVPASVVVRAVDGATAALKKLLDVISDTSQVAGRPSDARRQSYDLAAQRFAFNSFEVAFAPNHAAAGDPAVESLYEAAGDKLNEALEWLQAEQPTGRQPDSDLLDVLSRLVPPSHGRVSEVEISGRMFPDSRVQPRFRLTRTHGARVRAAVKKLRTTTRRLIEAEGTIRQLDLDALTFTLRERTPPAADLECSFIEFLLDDVHDAFTSGARVSVVGELDNAGKFDLAAIQLLAT